MLTKFALLFALLGSTAAAPAAASGEPTLPSQVTPPAGSVYITSVHAVGTQNYVCTNGTFVFSRPEAKLYATEARPYAKCIPTVGIHYFLDTADVGGGRATWEFTDAPTSVVTVKTLLSLPSPDGTANIPWLLTNATSHEGTGVLSNVQYVVRHNTKAGTAAGLPTSGCTAGAVVKQPYTATYSYYGNA
ncbi:hypothetical protein BJ742DRAFT_734045 [Cladochytrium replicatum]|nr:hypothetical protein BJ742DRAFT_734045 [Cladochytrium replicatum]